MCKQRTLSNVVFMLAQDQAIWYSIITQPYKFSVAFKLVVQLLADVV